MEINTPKGERDTTSPIIITVAGPAEGVSRAIKAINELVSKGYTKLLAGEDFKEGSLEVHPRYAKYISSSFHFSFYCSNSKILATHLHLTHLSCLYNPIFIFPSTSPSDCHLLRHSLSLSLSLFLSLSLSLSSCFLIYLYISIPMSYTIYLSQLSF